MATSTGDAKELYGLWSGRMVSCGMGYQGNWAISPCPSSSTGSIQIVEQAGAKCCLVVPNCFLKSIVMTPDPDKEGSWSGVKGCKPVAITKVSENELRFNSTDGPMVLTRL